jgi:hypothetical protein
MYDADKVHGSSPRSKHMNGQNGYANGHMRIEHPKSREMTRGYDHHESYSSQGYQYARSNASTDSGPEYSPPTATISEPSRPYSPYYAPVGSPRDYPRGAHTPPYYPSHGHHSSGGPPPLSLPPTSHESGRALPPPTSLLRQSPPPRHESPQLPPIYGMDNSRHVPMHHPHGMSKRDGPDLPIIEQLESIRHSNEQLRSRVMELELVNDLMKSRVAELESSEQRSRTITDSLKSDVSKYQLRENELLRKIDKLQDELVNRYKLRHSRSPSQSSHTDDLEESPSKRRRVLLSDIVDERSQLLEQQVSRPVTPAASPIAKTSPDEMKVENEHDDSPNEDA